MERDDTQTDTTTPEPPGVVAQVRATVAECRAALEERREQVVAELSISRDETRRLISERYLIDKALRDLTAHPPRQCKPRAPKGGEAVSERVTCECGYYWFDGTAWALDAGEPSYSISSGYCERCGTRLNADGTVTPMLPAAPADAVRETRFWQALDWCSRNVEPREYGDRYQAGDPHMALAIDGAYRACLTNAGLRLTDQGRIILAALNSSAAPGQTVPRAALDVLADYLSDYHGHECCNKCPLYGECPDATEPGGDACKQQFVQLAIADAPVEEVRMVPRAALEWLTAAYAANVGCACCQLNCDVRGDYRKCAEYLVAAALAAVGAEPQQADTQEPQPCASCATLERERDEARRAAEWLAHECDLNRYCPVGSECLANKPCRDCRHFLANKGAWTAHAYTATGGTPPSDAPSGDGDGGEA